MSLASTPSSKVESSTSHDSIIGHKSRQLGFLLDKYKPAWAMNKVTLIVIDQIRTNLKIEGPYVKRDENSVGNFNNFKSATGCVALQHSYAQWMFLSKGTSLVATDGMGVEGWIINMHIEKNKLKPSGFSIALVFDKKFGIIPILSEYLFMSEMTKFEVKYTKKDAKKLNYPLCVITSGHSKIIQVIDPETGEVVEESIKFKEKNLISVYNNDPEFRRIFDLALHYSIQQRIEVALFRDAINQGITNENDLDEIIDEEDQVPQL